MASAILHAHDVFSPTDYFSNPEPVQQENAARSAIPHDADAGPKRHAACDECRKRKLKCSGEPTGCSRCVKNHLECIYSVQKQMGRPKKRQKTDEQPPKVSTTTPTRSHIDPNLSASDIDRTNLQNVCNAPLARSVRTSAARSSSLSNTPPSDHPLTPSDNDIRSTSYPTDYSLWPDFSSTVIPMPLYDSYQKAHATNTTTTTTDPDIDPNALSSLPTTPECPCLPNLYLTLSTLSTLSAYPVSSHTITTLSSAHRTARSVIYCPICPQKYQSGSQNVMLSNTLLTVLVDQWHRLIRSSASDIRAGFCSSPPPTNSHITMTVREDLEWRTFAYTLMRKHVFSASHPLSPPPCPLTNSQLPHLLPADPSKIITLSSLADSLERRQKQWHHMLPESSEFAKKMSNSLAAGATAGFTLEDLNRVEEENNRLGKDHLCIQLASHAKRCVMSLDRPPPVVSG